MQQIGERISVVASFGLPYRMRPVRFRWSGRLFDVREITYTWVTKEGRSTVYHFSVSDGSNIFELSFDSAALLWHIEGVADPV